jgi:hypothetical protein
VNDAVEALQAKVGADSSAVTTSLDYKVAQLEAVSPGKILQVVRATDATHRSTTSTTYVDVTGMSVTITPTSASSDIMIVASFVARITDAASQEAGGYFQITDSSNNAISGAEESRLFIYAFNVGAVELYSSMLIVGYATPATTSATTYKLRFKQSSATGIELRNASNTGQMYAIEVSA